jgi:hypothetical protein
MTWFRSACSSRTASLCRGSARSRRSRGAKIGRTMTQREASKRDRRKILAYLWEHERKAPSAYAGDEGIAAGTG